MTFLRCDLLPREPDGSPLDPGDAGEVLRELMPEFDMVTRDLVARYQGHVVSTGMGGTLVCFGYPDVAEDDSRRAVRTGLHLVTRIAALSARFESELGVALATRVGVHTGVVVTSTGHAEEDLSRGEPPMAAMYLQREAPPNAVVISSSTLQLVEPFFEIEQAGSLRLPGIAAPLAYSRIVSDKGFETRFEAVASHALTPIVGRDREMDLLLDGWESARQGKGGVVMLTAEAGLGSRGSSSRCAHAWPRGRTRGWNGAAFRTTVTPRCIQRRQYHKLVAEVLEEKFANVARDEPELVARHFAEADIWDKAAAYYLTAARQVLASSANLETLARAANALTMLERRPPGYERWLMELEVRCVQGSALVAATGWASKELGECYARARELSDQLPGSPHLAQIIKGQCTFNNSAARLAQSCALGEQLLSIARKERSLPLEIGALGSLCFANFWRGRPEEATRLGFEALEFYDAAHPALREDPGAPIYTFTAMSLAVVGLEEQALQVNEHAMAAYDAYTQIHSRCFILAGVLFTGFDTRPRRLAKIPYPGGSTPSV